MRLLIALVGLGLMVSGCGESSEPNSNAAGEISAEGNLALLMKKYPQGSVKPTPWAGYWWPFESDGISEAAALYDQLSGTPGSLAWEQTHHGVNTPGMQPWFGHCNGWAAAASLYPEPRAAVDAGGGSFDVAHQKALLSEIATEVKADVFGSRQENPDDVSSLAFQDVFPDVFFLVLTNYVGNGRPLILDRYAGNQVWNHPIAGYRIDPIRPGDYLGASAQAHNVHRVMMNATVWWLKDDVEPGILTEPFEFKDGPSYESRSYRFELWLDAPPVFDASGALQRSGTIIVARQGGVALGGSWQNGELDVFNAHPDYLWVPHRISPSTGFSNPAINASWVESHFAKPIQR
jgi:hypothetical protein